MHRCSIDESRCPLTIQRCISLCPWTGCWAAASDGGASDLRVTLPATLLLFFCHGRVSFVVYFVGHRSRRHRQVGVRQAAARRRGACHRGAARICGLWAWDFIHARSVVEECSRSQWHCWWNAVRQRLRQRVGCGLAADAADWLVGGMSIDFPSELSACVTVLEAKVERPAKRLRQEQPQSP